MGMESMEIINGVHRSLGGPSDTGSKQISDVILEKLDYTVNQLKNEKQKRMDKLDRLGKALVNLWNLMDAPIEDREQFIKIAIISPSVSQGDNCPGNLTVDILGKVEGEVARLDQLKSSKMKELFFKKRIELENICKNSHMELPPDAEMDRIMNVVICGEMEHSDLIMSMEERISMAKEEAESRKDIMEKVEKWMAACHEERWLEEFSRDENRYSVSRGAHKNLRRAERGRITVNRIPGLVEIIMVKTKFWEEERKKRFLYDEVPLMAMLKEYMFLRREKEEDIHRMRERKRAQILREKDELYSWRPGTSSHQMPHRGSNCSFSNNSSIVRELPSHKDHHGSSNSIALIPRDRREAKRAETHRISVNHRPALKTDTMSVISATFSGSSSP